MLASRPYRDEDYRCSVVSRWQDDCVHNARRPRKDFVLCFGPYRSLMDRSVKSTQHRSAIGRPRWLPDGSGLLAPIRNVDQAFRGQLWFISYPGGEARRLTNDLMDYQPCCLDLTPDGKTLVDTELTTVSDLWVASAGNTAKAKQITTKEFVVGGFSWMPNGRIIFASQDGNLFAVNQDGSGRTSADAR